MLKQGGQRILVGCSCRSLGELFFVFLREEVQEPLELTAFELTDYFLAVLRCRSAARAVPPARTYLLEPVVEQLFGTNQQGLLEFHVLIGDLLS